MASKKHAATLASISEVLLEKLGQLHTSRDHQPETAAASVRHESLVIDIWSLQFQLAHLRLAGATKAADRDRYHRQAMEASHEIAEHEKRLRVARRALLTDDKELEAEEHDQHQEDLGAGLLRLAGKG